MKNLFFLFSFLSFFTTKAQVDFIEYNLPNGKKDTIYTIAETMPKYWNGNDVLFEELVQKFTFPPMEREKKRNATLPMIVTIARNGQAKELDLLEKVGFWDIENEVITKAEAFFSPNKTFTPATVKGRDVNAVLSFDVIYKCDRIRNVKAIGNYIVNYSIDTIMINDLTINALYKKIIRKNDSTLLNVSAGNELLDMSKIVHENAIADVPASFVGGTSVLMEWLAKNVKYPTVARENNIQGRVVLKFIIETDGSVDAVNILKK